MALWNKIDWYCPECMEYWMTTENCSPYVDLRSDCICKNAATVPAIGRCNVCGQHLEQGEDLCTHVTDRSQAI